MTYLTSFPYCRTLRLFPFVTTLGNTIMCTSVHKSVFEFLTIIGRRVARSKGMDLLKALHTNCHMLSRKVCSRWAYLNGQCYHHTPSVKDPFPHQGQPTEPEHLCRLVRLSSLLDNVTDIKQKCFYQISIWREWKERCIFTYL